MPTLSPSAYRAVAVAALAMLTLIVLSGAGVRLSGSGLGCPDWPRCDGSFIPELSTHVFIEYGNRVLSAFVGLVSIAAGLLVFRRRPFRRDLVAPAVVLPVGVVAQGVLGGITVLLELSWPVVVAHYLLSMVLLVAAAVLVWREWHPAGAGAGDRGLALAVRVLVVYGGLVIAMGTLATAAGPHAGGAGTGDVVERLDVWGATTLKSLIHLHGHMATAMGVGAVLLWLVAVRRGAGREVRLSLTTVCVLLAAQGIVGLVQYHSALPAEVVWVHASLAAVLWSALIWAWCAAGRLAPARDEAYVTSRSRPVSTS